MSFTRVNVAGWSSGAELTSSQQNQLDIDHANALDKTTAGDTLSGVVALASTAELNLQYPGNVVVNGTGAIQVLAGQGVQVQAGGSIAVVAGGKVVGSGPDTIIAAAAGAISGDVAGGVAATVAGGVSSGIDGGIALTGSSADWPTFGAGGSAPRGRLVQVGLDGPVAMTSVPVATVGYGTNFLPSQTSPAQNPQTVCGGFVTQVVSASDTAGYAYYIPLRLLNCINNGGVLSSVTLTLIPTPHTSMPSFMPRFGVFAIESGNAMSGRLSLNSGSNFSVDASANVTAYNAPHVITYTCNQNNEIDTEIYQYFLAIIDEGDTANAEPAGYFQGILLIYTGITSMAP